MLSAKEATPMENTVNAESRFPFEVVPAVTDQHAERFVEGLFGVLGTTEVFIEGLSASGIINESGLSNAALDRVIEVQREIELEFLRLIRRDARAAFREAASNVLCVPLDKLAAAHAGVMRAIRKIEEDPMYIAHASGGRYAVLNPDGTVVK